MVKEQQSSGVIGKALSILEYVGLGGERSFAEIVQHTKLPKSSLHRLLNIMVQEGFLRRSSHGNYRGAMKLWRIGASVAESENVQERIIPTLRKLVERTSETAHYSVYEDGWSVYVAKVEAAHPIRAGATVGGRSPAYASATGKAVLAWQTEDEIVRIGNQTRAYTDMTIIGAEALLKECEAIRKSGIAVSRGEWYVGLWAVATPIFEPGGNVRAAIGVAGPASRFEKNLGSYGAAVLDVARSWNVF